MDRHTVTYIVKNDMGGITSLIKNLVEYRGADALPQELIFLRIAGNNFATHEGNLLEGVPTVYFDYDKRNNFYYIFRKLRDQVGDENGVLISNDMYDLLMLTHYNINKKVIQLVHDAYNVRLSIQFSSVVDKFVCHSYFYYEVLRQLLPDRRDDIHFINYGIPIAEITSKRVNNHPLQLVFIGRHDKAKGIYDLFEINKILKKNNTAVNWLILGRGPETAGVKEQWKDENNVTFYTAGSSREIIDLCMEKDILVFPTKFEGFPVAMVEAMSTGCVPVVSDLPGGIRELGSKGNAIICALNDNEAFAEAISSLDKDRAALQRMSAGCIEQIRLDHDAIKQSVKYQQLFKQVAVSTATPGHHSVKQKLGSRLDQPFLPNAVTKFFRKGF